METLIKHVCQKATCMLASNMYASKQATWTSDSKVLMIANPSSATDSKVLQAIKYMLIQTLVASKQSATDRNKQAMKEIEEKQASTIDTNPN